MKVKATSTGTPPLPGAEAFARLLAAAVEKRPELNVVEVKKAGMVRLGKARQATN